MTASKSALLLLPNLLGESAHADLFFPASVFKAVSSIDGLIAESYAEGRRYLGRFETKKPAAEIPVAQFNEHTPSQDIDFLLEPIIAGERWGLISDAGLPCIADPGSLLVHRANQRGIRVQAFTGPSSILLALMLSGLPGQKFFFHGYLNKEPAGRIEQIKKHAMQAKNEGVTQICIETPYRNKHTLEAYIQTLPDEAYLCVAWDLTLPTQSVKAQKISAWKKCTLPALEKKPAIFLMNFL